MEEILFLFTSIVGIPNKWNGRHNVDRILLMRHCAGVSPKV